MNPKNVTRWFTPVALALCFFALPQFASADITTFNTNAPGGQGVFNGSGGVDGGFTVTATGDIAIGLRGALRTIGPITPVGNDYTCAAGQSCNFDFSVAGDHLAQFTYLLSVQDLTTNKSFSYDPVAPGNDNSYWGSSGKTSTEDLASQTIFQNSEYLGFSFLGLSWHPTDQVAVYLSATPTDPNSSLKGTTAEIGFNTTVPDGGMTLMLLGGVLAGVEALRRRLGA